MLRGGLKLGYVLFARAPTFALRALFLPKNPAQILLVFLHFGGVMHHIGLSYVLMGTLLRCLLASLAKTQKLGAK